MKRSKKRQGGFTMVELLIVVTIIGILVVPMAYMETYTAEGAWSGIRREQMTESGTRVIEWVAKDVRASRSLPENYGNHRREDSTLIVEGENATSVYRLTDQGKVERLEFDAPHTAPRITTLAANVKDLKIEVRPDGLVQTTVTMSQELLNRTESVSMSGLAARRLK